MKITGSGTPSVAGVGATAPTAPTAPLVAPAAPASAGSAALESAVLQPATKALAAMPDFDAARVAELRDALAKGELPFDPARLAGLIQRFHGGHS